jgi:hypothetical protein
MTDVSDLTLERRNQEPEGVLAGGRVMITPPLDEDFWAYRVKLTETQAVVGFPKFGVIGIGFAREDEDWNTNLPASLPVQSIRRHIWKNRGDDSITEEMVDAAIELIRDAVNADHG